MLASSQFFWALALSPTLASPVARLRVTPLSTTLVEAFTTVTPGVAEVRVTEQLPVASRVAQVGLLRPPGPLTMLKLMVVPAAALAKPVPSLTLTWPVRVWVAPISLKAVSGEIWMLASSQFFWALGLSPTWLSPVDRLRVTPFTTTVVEALITVVPTVAEVRVTEQLPVASRVAQVGLLRLPGPLTMLKLMVVPAAALTKPVPSLTLTCPVRVWVAPISLKAAGGEIWMLASSQFFWALALSPTLASPVARLRVTPLSTTLVEAFTTVTPGVAEVRVTEQLPVANTVAQLGLLRLPGPLTMLKLMVVPAAALTKPVPSLTLTCPVRVWVAPISLKAVSGEIWMLASSQFFWALALSPTLASPVDRLRVTPFTTTVVEALITVVPTVAEVRVTEQLPVASRVAQVGLLRLPGPLTMLKLMVVPAAALAKPVPSLTLTCPVR